MSDFDLRRRTFLKLLGLAGASTIITPDQASLLDLDDETFEVDKEHPSQNELWFKLQDRWFRVGDIIQFEMHHERESILVDGWMVPGIVSPPILEIDVNLSDGAIGRIHDAFANTERFQMSIFIADYEFKHDEVIMQNYMTEMDGSLCTARISIQAMKNGVTILPWKPGSKPV